jgi:hypothetical protein
VAHPFSMICFFAGVVGAGDIGLGFLMTQVGVIGFVCVGSNGSHFLLLCAFITGGGVCAFFDNQSNHSLIKKSLSLNFCSVFHKITFHTHFAISGIGFLPAKVQKNHQRTSHTHSNLEYVSVNHNHLAFCAFKSDFTTSA